MADFVIDAMTADDRSSDDIVVLTAAGASATAEPPSGV